MSAARAGRARRRAMSEAGVVTPFQRRVLAWIRDRVAETGECPTTTQVRDALGLGRASWHEHLAALERAGFIRRRSIEVVARAGGGLTADEVGWCEANPGRVRAMMAVAAELDA